MGTAPTALLVEDNLMVLDFLAEAVEELGYHVVQAIDGNSAVAAMRGDAFDLLIADHRLPGTLTGCDLAEQFRAAFPAARILLTSGEPLVGRLPAAGVSFLQKPYTRAMLNAALAADLVHA